ncbi:hypothetical protein PUP75_19780 [Pseudomonas chlororaphis]|uniref:hypothetical protein n=1 Tax=Pseudomonas chlororaphis TaxID=587753 RepID=UPI002368EA86|nr:hypothetical protein [Pseudomonas chlororaphis]WDH51179.1 hypothetical protein PUP75_19780 [Pseudomonas chlororaphis]
MTNASLEVSVAEFVKGVDDIFERQLKLMNELRESFRLIAETMQKILHPEELPPLEEIGVNNNYFHRKGTTSEVSKTKLPSPPVQF